MGADGCLVGLPGHWRVVPVAGKVPVGGRDWPSKAVRVDSEPDLPPGADGWGLLLGQSSSVIDVECDGPQAEALYAALVGADAPVCPTWASTRGRHRLFAWTAPLAGLPANIKLENDLEIRIGADRAQSVLPPAGGRKWLVHPSDCDPPPLPEGLWKAIASRNGQPKTENAKAPPEDTTDGQPIPEGERNQTLTALAGAMRRRGMTVEEIVAALSVVNARRCRPPLPAEEIRSIGESVGRYEPEPQRKRTGKESRATMLVDLALQAGLELWHTPAHEPMASIPVNGHVEHWPLRSRPFRHWLAHVFFAANQATPGTQSVYDALQVLEGQALFDGLQAQAPLRIAEAEGAIYLDLCDEQWRAVRVTPDGWQIADRAPVRFRRTKAMLPLPPPVRAGSLAGLRGCLGIELEHWALIGGWLLAAACPKGPYPVLVLSGEQGSGKSFLTRALRHILDPNTAPVRTPPRDPRDLMIAANNSWLIALDNMSLLENWLSDAICRLSTGGGFSTRMLYENDEECVFDAMRPVAINGIEDVVVRPDLLDRSFLVHLPPIPDRQRRPESALWAEIEELRPAFLGGLLDAMAQALRHRESVARCLTGALPRMGDAACWIMAGESALGLTPGTFGAIYTDNRQRGIELALEASPLATAVRTLMASTSLWEGSPADLLAELAKLVDEQTTRQRWWPRDAARLSGALRRLAPALRGVGITVQWSKRRGTRQIQLARQEQ